MIPVLLTTIKTRDGIALDGIVVTPKRKRSVALVWLHGLGTRFSSRQPLLKELAARCSRNGIAYLKFNTRGHDIVARGKKKLVGSGFEKFKECILDIRAMTGLAKRLGYTQIILGGHSTGANKALYYVYKTRDRSIKGLILVGPINDIAAETKRIGKKRLTKARSIAKRLARNGPGVLMPQEFGIYTGARYLSLYNPGSREDVFPYYNPRARWKELKRVRTPLAVIFGLRDEYLDRPAKNLIEVFKRNAKSTRSFSGIIVKGAGHGFHRKEKDLARAIMDWIRRAII